MLKVIYADSPQAKQQFFLENKSPQDLWLVSHIEAKRTLQNIFLETQTTIFNKSVLRASEYWQWLFSINCPDWRSVSESLIYALLEKWFSEAEIDVRYANLEMFRHFFGQALPLLIAENGPLLEEWLSAEPQRSERLTGWFEHAKDFWNFLKEKKWIGRSWVVNVLNEKNEIFLGDFERCFIDLGLDLRQEEVEIILKMSQSKDVTVLIPKTNWTELFGSSLGVYKKIIDAAENVSSYSVESPRCEITLFEQSSVLKETKSVISQVRELLNKGIQPAQIAVLSSNVEDYWDMLREHFLVEGVPLNKRYVLRAISLPSLQAWLARLNLAKADFDQGHLETFLFTDTKTIPESTSYNEFKKEFSHIYDAKQVRDFLQLPEQREGSAFLTLSEFVEYILSVWRGEQREIAEDIVDIMAQDLRPSDKLSYNLWLKYLELIISRYELDVKAADPHGVLISNFNQADWASLEHAFVLGCEQNRLREITPTPLTGEDAARIELDLGFYIQRSESHKKEFELRWFTEKNLTNITMSHSHSDFEGSPQMSASYWLELEAQKLKTELTEVGTRWDILMKSNVKLIQKDLNQETIDFAVIENKLSLEKSLEHFAPILIDSNISLSAGSLKKYFDCPFQFYVEKVLKLKDQSEYDLDVDPLFQGQIWHKIVEEIHNRYPDLNILTEQLDDLYELALNELDVKSPLKRFWVLEKPRHLMIIRNFLELEREWRLQFTKTKTTATELAVKGYIGVVDEQVQLSEQKLNDSFYPFNGRIDRVDQDSSGQIAIVDYKTSKANLKAFKNWPKNGQFQMPLYALALEAGLATDFARNKVVSASYFVFKDKMRGLGYVLDGEDHDFGDLNPKAKRTSMEDKEAVFDELLLEIKNIFEKLRLGFFKPEPRDQKICERCIWSRVCRAPHLK